MILTIVLFIAILGLLVLVHELGHFWAAKRAGMQVEEFGFGFPPRLFGIRWGETLYSINLIFLGGFVKIVGEDGAQTDNPGSFASHGFWPRFSVLIAGVAMNVVLAWLLVSLALGLGVPTIISENESLPASATMGEAYVAVTEVAAGAPAEQAGIKPGDALVSINSEPVDSLQEVQELTRSNAGQLTTYGIRRGDQQLDVSVTPRVDPPEGQGALGIALATVARVSYPWYEALYRGVPATYNMLEATVSAFGRIIGQWVSGQQVSMELSGPVGIAVLTKDVAALGFIYLLQFTAILSINLAVINAVPFPALDGGRILFLIIEKIRRRKLPEKAEQIANTVGFALLLLLMAFVTVKDFGRFEIFDRIKNLF